MNNIKRLKQPTMEFCNNHTDASYHTNHMIIDLNKCKQYSKLHDIDYYEYVARVINHEFIHHIMCNEQDTETSICFDDYIHHKTKGYKENLNDVLDFWLW